ncbi:F-box/LRR-repeat protein At1g55660-like [Vigna umbellata]|uniref:F-box/LRR-repeat protein At1g55660-like n=1 Tax=Vigna umbellata TaxID=87088 RepID=UPI001F5E4FFD|nr:F-box/LRR-repeat protein At1g55660-like [Vigna umbellata]
MKRKRTSESGERGERKEEDRLSDLPYERKEEDKLSDLPDEVLQHMMEFLPTTQAIKTCVLSKRWKNLWKGLTTLTFKPFKGIRKYNRYVVNHVLSHRDDSISLHKMSLTLYNSTKVLNNAIKYASQHHLQELQLLIMEFKQTPNSFIPLFINCKSLTLLVIFSNSNSAPLTLPPSFAIPSLKNLFLFNVIFTAKDDNNCVEPFSECTSLISLVLERSMHTHSTKTLCISNPSLSVLNMKNILYWHDLEPEIVLFVPKLKSITFENDRFSMRYRFSCTCDLPLLTRVKISNHVYVDPSIIVNWLRIFSNVRKLTICSRTLNMLKDICPDTLEIQPPRFARLRSLKIKMHSRMVMSKTELNMIVSYLWNCQTTNVKVIECQKS